jgi:tetratricopeptide (TPR) repeat protein
MMRRLLSALILLLFSSGLFSCAALQSQGSTQEAEARYKIGVAYLNEKKIQQAFLEFQHAHDLNPNNKEVLNALGIIYLLHFDETTKSIDYFQKAVRVDPSYSEALNNLGYAHEKLGRFADAIPYYKRAVTNLMYATPENAYVNMGNAYYRLGKYEEAATAYKEALKRAPALIPAHMKLALCYNAMGRYGDASAAMTNAIDIDPRYKGNQKAAHEDLLERKLTATGYEQKDIADLLEILKY